MNLNIKPRSAQTPDMNLNIKPRSAQTSDMNLNIKPRSAQTSDMNLNIKPRSAQTPDMNLNIKPRSAQTPDMNLNINPMAKARGKIMAQKHGDRTFAIPLLWEQRGAGETIAEMALFSMHYNLIAKFVDSVKFIWSNIVI